MHASVKRIGLVILCASVIGGCQSMTGSKTGDTLLGCGAVGVLTGVLAGGKWGAVAGASCALASMAYHATQSRSAADDQNLYSNSDPDFYGLNGAVTSPQVKIRSRSAAPQQVQPGQKVTVVTDYSLNTPNNMPQIQVQESVILKKDGQTIKQFGPRTEQRTKGGWSFNVEIPVADQAEPGTYVLEHKIQAGTSYDTDTSVFVVGA